MPTPLLKFRTFAAKLAKLAGQGISAQKQQPHTYEYKLKNNFKIEADDEADRLIRFEIAKEFPTHNIYSEENDNVENESEYTWVVDPLDGTMNYALQISDIYAVSIGLAINGKPAAGAIYLPGRDELYEAESGGGAWLNGKTLSVSNNTNINKAVVGLDYGKLDREQLLHFQGKLLSENGVNYTPVLASAASQLAFVSSGKFDGFLATNLEPWDMAAACIIIQEAGGIVTAANGQPWDISQESILAANPALHEQLLSLIQTA